MKIKKLIAAHDRVDNVIKSLAKHIPKDNEFVIDRNNITISRKEAMETIECLIWLKKLLNNTIENVSVTDLQNIDDCLT